MQVLIASRDPRGVATLTTLLAEAGHQFELVVTIDAALRAALLHDFDLLICDLELPDFPRLELVHALKSQAPELPVMVLCGSATSAIEEECAAAGVACVLRSPVDPSQIREELGYLGKARLSLSVAVVDRDPIHRVRLVKAFERLGCAVTAMNSGAALRDFVAQGHRFGLALLDVTEADAVQTVRACRGQNVPVFIFAENLAPGGEDEAIRAGAALFFAKPVDCEAMLSQVRFFAAA